MATLNKRIRNTTHEGAPARNIDLISQLERSVMSCLLWEKEFYEQGEDIAKRIIDLCSKVPADEVARIAIQAKEDMRLRHVPLLLARELARTKDGRAQLKYVLPKIIVRADEPGELLAMYWKDGKDQPIAKQIKKHLGEILRRFDEYQLAKYSGGQRAVKLKDVIKLVRPKPQNEVQSELWKRLVKDELKTPDTWEVRISACKSAEEKKAAWKELLSENKLGGLALLRNIRNMREAGVEDDIIERNIRAINSGKLLPINFIAAAKHNVQFESVLEQQFLNCFSSTSKTDGSTIILVDVSGSMEDKLSGKSEMTRMDVACSLAMIGREMFEKVRVFTFSNSLVEVPARQGFALRDAIINSQGHGGTELGHAIRSIPKCDRLIVITDEQSQDSVPDVKGYMINVASAKNGVGYGQWVHVDGWSDKVLSYILKYEAVNDR